MSSNSSRRVFLTSVAAAAATGAVAFNARAQTMVEESDPQAQTLGYVTDASKADSKKYPKYQKGEHCGNCALFQGKPTDAAGPCPLFAGKQVAGAGWCSAWSKKA